jgi:hypothetical protein
MPYWFSTQYNGPSPAGGESKSLVYNSPEGMKFTVSFNQCEVLFPCRFASTMPVRTKNHF